MLRGLGALLDPYARQARLEPALLTLLPIFITIAVWFPALYSSASVLASSMVAIGVVALLAHIARIRGRRAERRLWSAWGGAPTTQWLRHRDRRLGALTLAKHHTFLAREVPGWTAPTPEEEVADPSAADERYEDAINWLRECTRDTKKYPLLFKELISYGFRRNLYGLRIVGLPISVLCVLANVALMYRAGESLSAPDVAHLAAIGFSAISTVGWLLLRPAFVRDAADVYAQRLLTACLEVHAPHESTLPRQARRRTKDSST